jgi:hypothetical protein
VLFILGKISSIFELKNMNLTYAKDFPWKKMAQIRQISKRKSFWMITTSATSQNWGEKKKKKKTWCIWG